MKLAYKHSFSAIGTEWSVETATPLSKDVRILIAECVSDFDKVYSRFRNDSLVMKARKDAPGAFTFPASIKPLLTTYKKLSFATNGKVNPLVGESLEHLGYDENYTLVPKSNEMKPALKLEDIVQLKGSQVVFTQPALLDIGAIGKGFLVDRVAEIVATAAEYYVVDASGDIYISNNSPEVIGLENPHDPTKVIGAVSLIQGSLCGSGINRRRWGEGLHHVLDATTGKPVRGVIATWAVADSAMIADALATALFFANPETLAVQFGAFNYVTISEQGQVAHNIQEIGEIYI
jgi:thiamine biosynthesis lipoprotein